MSVPDESTGNLISLEGDVSTISTQLRLLPPSSKILTISSFSSALAKNSKPSTGPFDARAYISQVHETFTQRFTQAREFLKSSTGAQPRLVFMNGGCVSARTACITKISEELAGGDAIQGERIFNTIISDGVAGLTEPEAPKLKISRTQESKAATELPADSTTVSRVSILLKHPGKNTNTILEAIASKPDKASLTGRETNEKSLKNGVPLLKKGGSKAGAVPESAPESSRPSFEKRTSFGSYDSEHEDAEFEEAEEHPNDEVVYGEACVVAVQKSSPTTSQPLRKSRSSGSLDHKSGEHPPCSLSLRRVRSLDLVRPRIELPLKRGASWDNLPRTVYVRRPSNPKTLKPVYVDAGTSPEIEEKAPEPFEPVFPLVEDLIIHFADGNSYEVFDAVMRTYRDGSYPVIPKNEERAIRSGPGSPETRPISQVTVETDDEGQSRRGESNPYTSHLTGAQTGWSKRTTSKTHPSMLAAEPLTPAESPPQMRYPSTRFEKFIDFTPTNTKTAVSVQNAFRAILAQRFPPALGYKQQFWASETERLWKPVLRNDEGFGNEGRTVDLILAVGGAERVSRGLCGQISGMVEGLGRKRDGRAKSAGADMRYFINLALSSMPVNSPVVDHPLSNPHLLACLLLPQLEAYLASNTTRLLVLRYESVHIPTVLALRTLFGDDAFKVAGILDSSPSSIMPSSAGAGDGASLLSARSRFASASRTNVHYQTSRSSAVTAKRPDDLLPRSNFLLSSAASQIEQAEFLSSIRKVLVVKSSFYDAEPEPATIVVRPVTPTASVLGGLAPSTTSSATIPAPPPVPKSPKTAANARPRSRSRAARTEKDVYRDGEEDGASVIAYQSTVGDWDSFVDSEDDEIDRMFMPAVPRRVQRKGNSRKALKWLGLA